VTTADKDLDRSEPLGYQNGDIIWANFEINKRELAPYLPPGVTSDEGEAVVWIVRWKPADFLNPWGMAGKEGPELFEYNELWVEVPVVINGARYMFPLVLLLDDDVGMVAGRDMGLPKKLANTTYTFSPAVTYDAFVNVDVSRRGAPVYKLTGRMGVAEKDIVPVWGVSDNRTSSPGIALLETTQFAYDPEISRPTWLCPHSMNNVTEQRPLHDVEVEFGSDPTAPLGRWFEKPATRAGYLRMDQDWMLTVGGAQLKLVELNGYYAWWKRSFALQYM